ncbi:hypothetical protein G6O67_001559 [Ophiocordyceps sinensis]|uniref:Uncharacterized protein n=1 Tax=Ophiocordyceps sinensis TaxID=72228 RepID=A0A8H4V8Y0_9HYPO|nr:hypothetical protein G6O67_001559 [Ophiocordyceps sinensis]
MAAPAVSGLHNLSVRSIPILALIQIVGRQDRLGFAGSRIPGNHYPLFPSLTDLLRLLFCQAPTPATSKNEYFLARYLR